MKKISLTFDNGPTPGITEHVLDALGEYDIKATFFLVGTQLEKPEGRRIAERALAEGHRLGNHTYFHGDPLGLHVETGSARREIRRMHALMGELAGDTPLFRPNGRGTIGSHLLNAEAVEELERIGATVVLWTSVPRDRKAVVSDPEIWVQDARAAVSEQAWPLIVLHDRPSGFPAPGPMAFLTQFLALAVGRYEFTKDFPEQSTPMLRGIPTSRLGLVTTTHPS